MQEQASRLDQGGRRLGQERRQYVYSGHIPERRSGSERRCGVDRRSGLERRENPASNVVDMAVWKERRLREDRRLLPPPYELGE